jgi:hypothetical protein
MKPRENPFRTERVLTLRYRFTEDDWTRFLARLRASDYRGAIVGPEGSGKTTLLEDLGRRLARLPPEERGEKVVLVDGFEQLSWLERRRLLQRAPRLVVTSHGPCSLPTLLETRTSPELLRSLVHELQPGISAQSLDRAFFRHNGNLRLVFRELYDRCANAGGESAVRTDEDRDLRPHSLAGGERSHAWLIAAVAIKTHP